MIRRRYTSDQLRTIRGIIWEILERNRYKIIDILPPGFRYYFLPNVIGIANSFTITSASIMIIGESIEDQADEVHIANIAICNWEVKPNISIFLYDELANIEQLQKLLLELIEPLTKWLKPRISILNAQSLQIVNNEAGEASEKEDAEELQEIKTILDSRCLSFEKQAKEFRQKIIHSKDRYKITLFKLRESVKNRSCY